ncbi:MAG: flippase-like domain-containing protein [Muribaculaceae bacterium]|nr:flippase-like domain-containing protein [Muribaculaceae bacterium]
MTQKINLRTILQYIVPPIITVGLCIFLYRDMDWAEVMNGLKSCNFLLLSLFLICNVISMIARAMRWRIQLRAMGLSPRFGEMLRSIFGTYAVNLIFPRLGEIWRCTYMSKVTSSPFSGIFGSMIADRLADTLVIFLMSVLTFMFAAPAMAEFAAESDLAARFTAIISSPWVIFAVFILFIFCILCIYSPARIFVRIRQFVNKMWQGFTALFTMERGQGLWLLLTAIIWVGYCAGMFFSLYSFPPTAALLASNGFLCGLLAFIFGSLAMAVPSNGGIGPWQAAVMICLCGIYGMDPTAALTFATINVAFSTLLTIALGLYTFAVPARR